MKTILIFLILSCAIFAQNQLKVVLPDTTTSIGIDKGKDWVLKSIRTPGDFEGTSIRFLSSDSLWTYLYYVYDGDTLDVPVLDSLEIGFKPVEMFGLGRYFKLMSNAEEDSAVIYLERHLFEP